VWPFSPEGQLKQILPFNHSVSSIACPLRFMSFLHRVDKMNVCREVESLSPSSCSVFEPLEELRLKFGNMSVL